MCLVWMMNAVKLNSECSNGCWFIQEANGVLIKKFMTIRNFSFRRNFEALILQAKRSFNFVCSSVLMRNFVASVPN